MCMNALIIVAHAHSQAPKRAELASGRVTFKNVQSRVVKGVLKHFSRISVLGSEFYLGTFDTPEDAAAVRLCVHMSIPC